MSDGESGAAELPRIGFEHFLEVEIRTGTVLEAQLNPKARVPAYRLSIDFGPRGVRTSSAQITGNYTPDELVGRQVVAVLNFEPKRVAGVKSEVLVLGAVSEEHGVVLLEPSFSVENGARIA
jgi:tRNA-binding protein